MAKGIIVVDVPENCRDCDYFGMLCKITNKKCHYHNEDGRPDWCPIKEIPSRIKELKQPHSINDYQRKGFSKGWNACLEEIERGCDMEQCCGKRIRDYVD